MFNLSTIKSNRKSEGVKCRFHRQSVSRGGQSQLGSGVTTIGHQGQQRPGRSKLLLLIIKLGHRR